MNIDDICRHKSYSINTKWKRDTAKQYENISERNQPKQKKVEQGTKREELVIYIPCLGSPISSGGYDLSIFDDDTANQSSK